LKNLESFDHIPAILNEPVFYKAFKTAELANLSREQYTAYEQNLLDYWGVKAAVQTAREEGDKAARLETASKLWDKAFSLEEICELYWLEVEGRARIIKPPEYQQFPPVYFHNRIMGNKQQRLQPKPATITPYVILNVRTPERYCYKSINCVKLRGLCAFVLLAK